MNSTTINPWKSNPFYAPLCGTIFTVGDILTFVPDDTELCRIGLILDTSHDQKLCNDDSSIIQENRIWGNGTFLKVLWYLPTDEYNYIKVPSVSNHESIREVVESDLIDWMPSSQVNGIVFIFHYSYLDSGICDITGMKHCFFIRYNYYTKSHRLRDIRPEDWYTFSDQRLLQCNPPYNHTSFSYQYWSFLIDLKRLFNSGLCRNRSQDTSCQFSTNMKTQVILWNYFKYDINMEVFQFHGIRKTKHVRSYCTLDSVRVHNIIELIRVKTQEDLNNLSSIIGSNSLIGTSNKFPKALHLKKSMSSIRSQPRILHESDSITWFNLPSVDDLPIIQPKIKRQTYEKGIDITYDPTLHLLSICGRHHHTNAKSDDVKHIVSKPGYDPKTTLTSNIFEISIQIGNIFFSNGKRYTVQSISDDNTITAIQGNIENVTYTFSKAFVQSDIHRRVFCDIVPL